MRDAFVDVTLEVSLVELARESDPSAYILEKMRGAADTLCDRNGARLRTDRKPEIHIKEGRHIITQEDVLLCASRWAVVAPESVDIR